MKWLNMDHKFFIWGLVGHHSYGDQAGIQGSVRLEEWFIAKLLAKSAQLGNGKLTAIRGLY